MIIFFPSWSSGFQQTTLTHTNKHAIINITKIKKIKAKQKHLELKEIEREQWNHKQNKTSIEIVGFADIMNNTRAPKIKQNGKQKKTFSKNFKFLPSFHILSAIFCSDVIWIMISFIQMHAKSSQNVIFRKHYIEEIEIVKKTFVYLIFQGTLLILFFHPHYNRLVFGQY